MKEAIKKILLADYSQTVLGLLCFLPIAIGMLLAPYIAVILLHGTIIGIIIGSVVGTAFYTAVLYWLLYRKQNGKSH